MDIRAMLDAKRRGLALGREGVGQFVRGAADGSIPDYQVSAMLMAMCINGLDEDETAWLTEAIAGSGETLDFSGSPTVFADKHSTGGVGDKATLVVGPMLAACGLGFAKLSGRGLGHTGGTVDKLESIHSMNLSLTPEGLRRQAMDIGLAISEQGGAMAPADKALYAMRDVTATVESAGLIAGSIMGKKLAGGADCLMLDVKAGSGAFMGTVGEARALAGLMVAIGRKAGMATGAMVTGMWAPLGRCVGNALEVREAMDTLCGRGPDDLTHLCVEMAASALCLARRYGKRGAAPRGLPGAADGPLVGPDAGLMDGCRAEALGTLRDGSAYGRFARMVESQGGDLGGLPDAAKKLAVRAPEAGYVTGVDARRLGEAVMAMGGGRARKGDPIDHSVGAVILAGVGDRVAAGEPVAEVHCPAGPPGERAAREVLASFAFGPERLPKEGLIIERIGI